MAGFDKVDPADLCLPMSSLQCCPRARVGRPPQAGGWVRNLIEKCQRESWIRELQWSKNTPCTGEPKRWARFAC
jgi:hypothetical protein